MPADAPRPPCQAQRRDGQACGGVAGPSGFCFAHDPELAARRKEGNRQGGQNKDTTRRLTKLVPSSLKPVLETLFTALDEVHGYFCPTHRKGKSTGRTRVSGHQRDVTSCPAAFRRAVR